MPWTIHAIQLWEEMGPSNSMVATCEDIDGTMWSKNANARRIVACVNACKGMADPANELGRLRLAEAEADAWRQWHDAPPSRSIGEIMEFETGVETARAARDAANVTEVKL